MDTLKTGRRGEEGGGGGGGQGWGLKAAITSIKAKLNKKKTKKKKKHYKRVMHGSYLPQQHNIKPLDKHARLVSRPSTAR